MLHLIATLAVATTSLLTRFATEPQQRTVTRDGSRAAAPRADREAGAITLEWVAIAVCALALAAIVVPIVIEFVTSEAAKIQSPND